jgi:bis(5'-nucleosyl)-tetraphosphatase (symmetrical)
MSRLIVYGDIHGCYKEFLHLRSLISIQKYDVEICAGDTITRGKDSVKTLRYIQKNNIKSVVGNHENKIIRYLKHEKSGVKNPIELDQDEKKIVRELSVADVDFMNSMPLFLRFGRITVLHAGVQNHFNLDSLSKEEMSKVLRLRYITNDGKFIPFGEEDSNSIFWSEVYNGKQGFIVYGHQTFEEVKSDKHSLGIDTGCVYGNKLSAVVFEDTNNVENYSIFSIKS